VLAERTAGSRSPKFLAGLGKTVEEFIPAAPAQETGRPRGPTGKELAEYRAEGRREVWKKYQEIRKDDIFHPKTTVVDLTSAQHRWKRYRPRRPDRALNAHFYPRHGGEAAYVRRPQRGGKSGPRSCHRQASGPNRPRADAVATNQAPQVGSDRPRALATACRPSPPVAGPSMTKCI
jgi:hypothetical protein